MVVSKTVTVVPPLRAPVLLLTTHAAVSILAAKLPLLCAEALVTQRANTANSMQTTILESFMRFSLFWIFFFSTLDSITLRERLHPFRSRRCDGGHQNIRFCRFWPGLL